MEDDNGLELSLGLSCGGGSGKGKANAGTSSTEGGGDRSAKVIDEFKNFLHPRQTSEPSDSGQQNFFNDLSKPDVEVEQEEEEEETGNKRKSLSSSANVDLHEKRVKSSHVSNATDEGSTAENEDVAESEVKEVVLPSDNLGGQKESMIRYSVHPPQNVVVTSLPYSVTVTESGGQHGAAVATTSHVHSNVGNLPSMFGYSPVQLPMLDKDGSGGVVGLSQSPFPGSGSATAKGEGKQPIGEEGSSGDAKERPTGDINNNTAFSFDFSAIKPGMAADVKFGGSGARPNLPWVSTTGSGPHGRTISGVTYRYNANQIKIVCACHGSHMSPEEFVCHASEEYVSPESSVGMTAA